MSESGKTHDPVAEFNAKSAKYGLAFAIMGDSFKGRGMTIVSRVVQVFILAAAIGVVGAAVWARVIG